MTQVNPPKTAVDDPFYNIDRILRNENVQKPSFAPPVRQAPDPFEGLRPTLPSTKAAPPPEPSAVNWGDLESEIASFTTAQKKTTAEYHAQAQTEASHIEKYKQLFGEEKQLPQDFQDEQYVPVPERKPRGGVKTIAAILGVALVGSLGVFGYRASTGGSTPATPTAIKAPTTPEKVVVQQPKEPAKSVMERAPNGQERVVPRDEKPLSPSQQAEQSTTQKIITGSNDPDEPKRVRTITISNASPAPQNSNGMPSVPSVYPAGMSPDITNVPTKAVRTQNVAPPPAEKPAPVKAVTPPAAAPPAKVVAPVEAVKPTPPKPAPVKVVAAKPEPSETPKPVVSRPASGGPMAIGPGSVQTPSVQQASVTPVITPKASASGNYVVQVGSAASEKEARDKFKAMQGKNSALAGKSVSVVEAEKADGSTFYRMRLSPTSKDSATALCNQLKATGGSGACFVVAN